MIIRDALAIASESMFLELSIPPIGGPILLKLEGLNIAGSIKFKAAVKMLDDLQDCGALRPGGKVIESSSGNLGLALAIVCAVRNYEFFCISDPNISPQTSRIIKSYGAKLIVVTERDGSGGYLQTRIATIRKMMNRDPELVWTNQYANDSNKAAHYFNTGPEILADVPSPGAVFIGAGTTGTLMGCAEYLRTHSPATRIYAVDSVGSILFSDAPGRRYLPGLGASRVPELLDRSLIDECVLVEERDTIAMCRSVVRQRGLLIGPSTGTVLAAIAQTGIRQSLEGPIVAVSPDFGDRYVDTLFNDDWVSERYGSTCMDDKHNEPAI